MNPLLAAFDWVAKGVRSRWGGRRALASFLMQGSSVGLYTNSWTDSRYEQVRHFKHWVYVAVHRICEDVAMHMPNVSYLRTPPEDLYAPGARSAPAAGRRKVIGEAARRKALTPLLAHEQLEPVPYNHPFLRLLRDPNEPDTAYDLWYETTLFLLLTGNAYWWLPRNALGKPAAIWVLPSHWVWANVGKERLIDSYEIRPVEGNYVRMSIPAGDVVHFRRKSPVSKIDGYSPLSAVSQWVDTQESIDRTRWFSFRNGAFPGVAIGFDERTKLPDEETLNRIEARFMGRYSGEINANKPLFIPPGAEVKKLHLSPHEMAYCESSEQMRDMILAAFGVPAAIANVSGGMTYGSVAATQAGYYMGTINPLYRFYGLNVSEKVAPRWRQGPADVLRVWWEDRTPEDPELREKTIVTDFSVGAITPQEVRQMRGREPYPHGGDNPFIQGAFVELPYATGRRELPAAPAVNAPPPEPPARPHGPDNPAGAGPAAEPDEPGDRLE